MYRFLTDCLLAFGEDLCLLSVILRNPLTISLLAVLFLVWLYRRAYNPINGCGPSTGELPADLKSTLPNSYRGNMGYRYPFTPYPTDCWYFVARGVDVDRKNAKPVKILGKDMVLWRTEKGEPVLQDAHCPHLGAHLGYGGQIKGDCIKCPFHGWKFDKTGRCSEIPYADKIPLQAAIRTYETCERNKCVYIWHGEGKPTFPVPLVPEIEDKRHWGGYRQRWRCRVHVQEMVENAVDTTHFNVTHAFDTIPDDCRLSVMDQVFQVKLTSQRTLLGMTDNMKITLTYHGMGIVVAEIDSRFLQLAIHRVVDE